MKKVTKLKKYLDKVDKQCDTCLEYIEKEIIRIVNEHNDDVGSRFKNYRKIKL